MKLRIFTPSRTADVERWAKGDVKGEAVKDRDARAVWRVPVGTPALYVKRFPPALLRDRARAEATLLRALQEAGIKAPRVVATARDASGSFVLTEEIPDARPLKNLLAGGGTETRRLLTALARFTKRLHDAGFHHRDLHIGNVLWNGRDLFVLDVHRADRLKRLTRGQRLEGVAFLAFSFSEFVPITELFRFLRSYGLDHRADVLETWKRFRRIRDRYYRSRLKRCVRESGGFGVRDGMCYRKGVDLESLRRLVDSPDRVAVKSESSRSLHRLPDGLFLKRTRSGRAREYWQNGHGLAIRGIPTPRLDACGPNWVIGEWIDAPNLYDFVNTRVGAMDRAQRDTHLQRLARTVRRMHLRGAFHADMKATNVLVSDERFFLVDLDRVEFSAAVPEADRIHNLAQLNASVTPPLTRTDRLRFLRFYFGREVSQWRNRRRWIEAIMRKTIARHHRWPQTPKPSCS